MRIKNLSPFLAGYKVTSRKPPRPEMTLVVRGTFVLAPGEPLRVPDGLYPMNQGSLTAEVFRDDDAERIGGPIYPGDFADFKLRAEVMLRGACHPPGGRAVKECPARLTVGKWSKTLYVVGPRAWAGEAISEPLPFTSMPLTQENAFGGPGYAPNPVGKGLGTSELPNVEHAGERVRARADRPAPAGFGPVNPTAPERTGKLGKAYGDAWRRDRAPFYAEDFDWSYWSSAPPDQQLEGYLRGDEEVTFQNLHPAAPLFSVLLPGLRVRAFVNDVRDRFREPYMALDTIFADLEEGRLYLTWRGVDPVDEDDLADVRSVLIADEPLAGPARSDAFYRRALEVFERDPAGLDDAVPANLRGPWAAMQRPPSGPAAPGGAPDPVSALLEQRLGNLAAPERAQISRAVAAFLAAPPPPGVDPKAALARAVNDLPRTPPAPPRPSLDGPPRVPIGGALRRALGDVASMRSNPATAGAAVPGLGQLDALAQDPRLRRLDPGFRPSGEPAPPPPEPGPGRDLSGQDLSGRDLRGVDLRGANLSDAILAGAQMGRANLAGATLARAVLADADLGDADLSGANLTLASLARARAPGANFSRATLDQLNAPKAVLADAIFDEARGEAAVFEGADLGRARARGATLEQAVFDGASLEGADFTGARLLRCRFLGARAAGARFERALLDGTSFSEADLTEAVFVEAQGLATIWLRAVLERADLRWAALPEAQLLEVKAAGARLRGADLRDARFYRAVLERADLSQSNLMSADLCKTVLTGASFAGASLYDAKLLGAAGEGCDFSGANLVRAIPERA
jgi:uncharacterized protein YjbI with pentapeptide repeats